MMSNNASAAFKAALSAQLQNLAATSSGLFGGNSGTAPEMQQVIVVLQVSVVRAVVAVRMVGAVGVVNSDSLLRWESHSVPCRLWARPCKAWTPKFQS